MAKDTKADLRITGIVEDIIRFRNSSDGVGVAKTKDSAGHIHSVIGVLVGIEAGDVIEVVGTEVDHPIHGKQLRAKLIQSTLPKNQMMLVPWLTRHFKIAWDDAQDLVDEFYLNFTTLGQAPHQGAVPALPYADMEFEVNRFFQLVRTEAPALREHFKKHNAPMEWLTIRAFVARKVTVDELLKLGLDSKEANALFSRRGDRAPAELRDDPYNAYYYIEGMPFSKVDKIYLGRSGRTPNDEKRLRAICLHELRQRADEGHTAMYYDDFLDFMSEKYETISAQRFIRSLDSLIPEFLTLYGSPQMIQLVEHARFETGIAEFITKGKVLSLPPTSEVDNGDSDRYMSYDDF